MSVLLRHIDLYSPEKGFSRMFNFVGYLKQHTLNKMAQNLEAVKDCTHVFGIGHYPLSILQVQCNSFGELFSKMSAFFCGHLHKVAGSELRTIHANGVGEFEVPDLKKSRVFRIFSVDSGQFSFQDYDINSDNFLLITNPKDSRYIVRGQKAENISFSAKSSHIRMLLFQKKPSNRVRLSVEIDGKHLGFAYRSVDNDSLWLLKWDTALYSTGFHTIKAVLQGEDSVPLVETRFRFSLDGTSLASDWNLLHFRMGHHVKFLFNLLIFLV